MKPIEYLNNAYDKNIHPLAMKALEDAGLLSGKPVMSERILQDGSHLNVPAPASYKYEELVRFLGKAGLTSLGLGGGAAAILGLAKRKRDKKHIERRVPVPTVSKDASVPTFNTNTGKVDRPTLLQALYHNTIKTPAEFLFPGKENTAMPITDKAVKLLAESRPADTSRDNVSSQMQDNWWGVPAAALATVGLGGAGFIGVNQLAKRLKERKRKAEVEKAKRLFEDALLREQKSKLGSALEEFISAAEEHLPVKEAGMFESVLGVLAAAGILGYAGGAYNGYKTDSNALSDYKAFIKARKEHEAKERQQSLTLEPLEIENSAKLSEFISAYLNQKTGEDLPDDMQNWLYGAGLGAGTYGGLTLKEYLQGGNFSEFNKNLNRYAKGVSSAPNPAEYLAGEFNKETAGKRIADSIWNGKASVTPPGESRNNIVDDIKQLRRSKAHPVNLVPEKLLKMFPQRIQGLLRRPEFDATGSGAYTKDKAGKLRSPYTTSEISAIRHAGKTPLRLLRGGRGLMSLLPAALPFAWGTINQILQSGSSADNTQNAVNQILNE